MPVLMHYTSQLTAEQDVVVHGQTVWIGLHPETDRNENEWIRGDVTRLRGLAWTCGHMCWSTTTQLKRERDVGPAALSVPSGCNCIPVSARHGSNVPGWTCLPITASASRCGGLRSATTSNLVIPRYRLSTYGTRAFSIAGPVCWNSLPDYLKPSDLSFDCFRQQL